MPINLECEVCRSDISISGFDEKKDIVIIAKCHNCLSIIKITKEKGKVTKVEVKKKTHHDGFNSRFNKYDPEDFAR